jgi:hypothetical protein
VSACECDYDFEGDPGRYVKCSRFCPEHDACDWCGDRMGSVKIQGRQDFDAHRIYWVCAQCAAEDANQDANQDAER